MRHTLMRLSLAFAVVGLSQAPFAQAQAKDHHYSAGKPGNAKKPARAITVTMNETDDGKMLFTPSSIDVKKGEQIRFLLVNEGAVKHEFMLASTAENNKHAIMMQKFSDMEHDDANGKTLEPKTRTELLWEFSKAGTFEFACLVPGHREAGMHGMARVK